MLAQGCRAYTTINYSITTASSDSWTSISNAQLGSKLMIGVEMTMRHKEMSRTWAKLGCKSSECLGRPPVS